MNIRNHPLHSCWRAMWARCTRENVKQYADYGGRGIKVCDRWKDFQAFVDDMGPRPPKHTLDRIDNDGDYTPKNCRWATRAQQLLNRRNTIYVEIEGIRYLAHELAKKCGHKSLTIKERAGRGLSYDEVVYKGRHRGNNVGPAIEARIRATKARTHCKRGHPFNERNILITKDGARTCRECARENLRRSRARARAKRAAKS